MMYLLEGATAADTAINTLSTQINSTVSLDKVLTYVADFAPVLGTFILIGIVMGIVRRVIKGASKGKARV